MYRSSRRGERVGDRLLVSAVAKSMALQASLHAAPDVGRGDRAGNNAATRRNRGDAGVMRPSISPTTTAPCRRKDLGSGSRAEVDNAPSTLGANDIRDRELIEPVLADTTCPPGEGVGPVHGRRPRYDALRRQDDLVHHH